MSHVADLVVASATVKSGKLFVRNRRDFDRQIAQFRDGLEFELTVQRRRAARSIQQNAYWWGVCLQVVSEHTGYTPDELHEIAKQMFLPKRLAMNDGNGEVVGEFVLGGSTRTLNTIEFGEFIEKWRQWAAETLDCNIPDPAEAL